MEESLAMVAGRKILKEPDSNVLSVQILTSVRNAKGLSIILTPCSKSRTWDRLPSRCSLSSMMRTTISRSTVIKFQLRSMFRASSKRVWASWLIWWWADRVEIKDVLNVPILWTTSGAKGRLKKKRKSLFPSRSPRWRRKLRQKRSLFQSFQKKNRKLHRMFPRIRLST